MGLVLLLSSPVFVGDSSSSLLPTPHIQSSSAIEGDLDNNCDVDVNDLNMIIQARDKHSLGPGDRRDTNKDGRITLLDLPKILHLCSATRCAILTSSCKIPEEVKKEEVKEKNSNCNEKQLPGDTTCTEDYENTKERA